MFLKFGIRLFSICKVSRKFLTFFIFFSKIRRIFFSSFENFTKIWKFFHFFFQKFRIILKIFGIWNFPTLTFDHTNRSASTIARLTKDYDFAKLKAKEILEIVKNVQENANRIHQQCENVHKFISENNSVLEISDGKNDE